MNGLEQIKEANRKATEDYLDKKVPKDSKEPDVVGKVNPHLTLGVDGKYRVLNGEVVW